MITEHFGRGAPTEGFSGTTVESCGNSCEILGVMSAQVCAFGKVLTQQTVGVLIRPSLPRAMRIAEVDRQIGVDPELGVLSHLRALVPGQRSSQLFRQGRSA